MSLKELWRSLNPYRGLESLKEQDADLFFGHWPGSAALPWRIEPSQVRPLRRQSPGQ